MNSTIAHQQIVEASQATLIGRLARHFLLRPHVWIDGRELATIAGSYAWRTRVSDLRRRPYNLRIDNRLRQEQRRDGSIFTVSEYAYFPETRS